MFHFPTPHFGYEYPSCFLQRTVATLRVIMSADELLRKRYKPTMGTAQLLQIIASSWGKNAHKSAVRQLESYDDCNFHVVMTKRGAGVCYNALVDMLLRFIVSIGWSEQATDEAEQIGRAHVRTPIMTAQIVCLIQLE